MEYKTIGGKDVTKKVGNFINYAKQFGWTGKWSTNEETGVTSLFARRGESETIEIWWQSNGCVMPGDEPIYTLAGERIRMRNVSAAAKIAASKPDPDRIGKAARRRNKGRGGFVPAADTEDQISELRGSLPFDSESDDDELEAVLHRRTVVWINRFTGQADSAFVNADKQFDVVRMDNDRDQIHFCDSAHGGYRAVYLNSIVSVG